MKPSAFAYLAPRSLSEALALASEYGDEGKLLAGGQSLMPALNFRLSSPAALIDLNRVAGLSGIAEAADGGLAIGAMTRHRAVETSAAIARRCPMLAAAMPHVAHVQIRNRGTIGGSISHADPAAEVPAVMLACDAQMMIRNEREQRTVTARDFFSGLFTTALDSRDILTEIRLPPWPAGRRCGFREINRRHGDFAIAGAAVWIDIDDADPDTCENAGIVLFGVSETPVRVAEAEQYLRGSRLAPAALREAGRLAASAVTPMADLHASADYRREVAAVLVRRALEDALAGRERRAA